MKTHSIALAGHLAGDGTSVCSCLKIILKNGDGSDGPVLGFTEHDEDIIFGEGSPPDLIIYSAQGGYVATNIQTSSAMNVDTGEAHGMLSDDSLTEEDLHAGLWDFARYEIFQVNWKDLTQGKLNQQSGWLGEVNHMERDVFLAELRGMLQAYSRVIGRLTQASCRYQLGDFECKVNMGPFTHDGTVATVSADNRTITADDLSQPSNYFQYGTVTFTSGLNLGRSMEVKSHTASGSPASAELVLQLFMSREIVVGDTFTAKAGCNKLYRTRIGDDWIDEHCITKFDNGINFGGEPYVIGFDAVVQPARKR